MPDEELNFIALYLFFFCQEVIHNIGNEDLLKNKLLLDSSVGWDGLTVQGGNLLGQTSTDFPTSDFSKLVLFLFNTYFSLS